MLEAGRTRSGGLRVLTAHAELIACARDLTYKLRGPFAPYTGNRSHTDVVELRIPSADSARIPRPCGGPLR